MKLTRQKGPKSYSTTLAPFAQTMQSTPILPYPTDGYLPGQKNREW